MRKTSSEVSPVKAFILKMKLRITSWFLEIEMGFIWGVSGLSIIAFIFAAIWYIDPALLTLVLKFKKDICTTKYGEHLLGIQNCSWTSCRVGCTKDIYECWQIIVESKSNSSIQSKLYPNVRGCGYPPALDCDDFFSSYGRYNSTFDCWVSASDPKIAITSLNLEKAKQEVLLSLIPLFIFIIFVLYAFCRLGVFSICNPTKYLLPRSKDAVVNMPELTPAGLFRYKKTLLVEKGEGTIPVIPDTIVEEGIKSSADLIELRHRSGSTINSLNNDKIATNFENTAID